MQDFRERDAIYLRKSRMDPESESINETLARHEDTLMKFAARAGLNITGVYKEVVSGDGLFTRPQMIQLLQDVDQGMYTGVVCMEIDRLGRSSQKDSGIIFETLKDNDVYIVTPNKTYDLNDEYDESSVEMQSFIARQELKSIRRRLRKGVEKSCEFGYHVSEPPYGYRRTYIDKHPTLEINEEEAQVIRMIFDMYVNQGLGGHIIAEKLNSMGYQPRKNDHFARNTIRYYLRNPVYIGKVVWNKYKHLKKKTIDDKNRFMLNDEKKWIVADGIHPPIVSQEIFEEAQRIRQTRSHPPSYTGTLQNPFAGLIYCKNCGAAMQRQGSTRSGVRLLCVNNACNRSIKVENIEKYILKFLRKVLADCKIGSHNNIQNEAEKKAEIINLNIQGLQKNLSTLNYQKSNLHDFLEKGVYSVETFLERSNVLSEKIKNINESIEEQQRSLSEVQTLQPMKQAAPVIEKLLDNYDVLSAAEKNQLLKTVIKRMTYLRTKDMPGQDFELDIEFRFSV